VTILIFIPDIPEFVPLVAAARAVRGTTVRAPENGYWIIEAERILRFSRRPMKLGPAIWNSALSGGFVGRIVNYGRDEIVIESEQEESTHLEQQPA
jgi:hypothetical protein